jgi:lipase chaperone LimK
MQRTVTLVCLLAVAAGVLWWFSSHERDGPELPSRPASQARAAGPQTSETAATSPPAAPPTQSTSPPAQAPTSAGDEPVAQSNDRVFRVDAGGRLVLDQLTRLNIEALIARTPEDELESAKQEAVAPLPSAASLQAADLIDRYEEYDYAQRQTYPPGQAPSTAEEALAELDGLHTLREAHFGPDVAKAFYGEEEALNRELIELMKLEKDQSLTLAEKAERAQRMRDDLPRIDAIEERNRDE